MGIIRPTKITGDIVVYTKWCIECEHPEWLLAINAYANHNDLDVQVIRTQYRPADHKRAAELWGSRDDVKTEDAEDYSTFVVKDGVYKMQEYLEMITYAKNKLVKGDKTKDDVQGLSQTKKPRRKNRVDIPVSQDKVANDIRAIN